MRPDSEHVEITELAFGILSATWKHRRFLVGVCVVGFVIGTIVSFLLPVRYEVNIALVPPDDTAARAMSIAVGAARDTVEPAEDEGRKGKSGSVWDQASNLVFGPDPGTGFVGILDSRRVQQNIVDRLNLKKVYRVRYNEDARKILKNRTHVATDPLTGLIDIEVTDREKGRAQAIAAAYVDQLNSLSISLSTSTAHSERLFLEDRLKVAKDELDAASADLRDFASKHALIDSSDQTKSAVAAATNLQKTVVAAESQLRGSEEIYNSNNPRSRQLRAQVSELKSQASKVRGADPTHGARYERDSVYPTFRELPGLGVTYADLYERVQAHMSVYETLSQQYEIALIHEARDMPVVNVLDNPYLPEKRSSPPRALIIFLAAVTALAGGFARIWAAEKWTAAAPSEDKTLLSEIAAEIKFFAIAIWHAGAHLLLRSK